MILLFPWSLPRLIMDDGSPTATFAPYPYASGARGLLQGLDTAAPGEVQVRTRPVAFAHAVESAYFLDGVVPATLDLRLMLPRRVELSARVSGLQEVRGPAWDRALMTTSLLSYRFAQSSHLSFRVGAGMRTFRLDQPRRGVDILLYAFDFYGARPLMGHFEFHIGSVGEALVTQARFTLGAMIGRVELYAGYDHTSFSGEAFLSGPCLGARPWW